MTTAQTGMHSVPPELKEHIARSCAEQDALLASALKKVIPEKALMFGTTEARRGTLSRAIAQNQSLVALAAVSREWNDLVAPFLFEALPIDKIDSEMFLKRVLPRRGHHFLCLVGTWGRHVEETASALVKHLAHALPKLPNLTQLYTPDLLGAIHADRMSSLERAVANRLRPDLVEMSNLEFDARAEAILDLLERAEVIMHPEMTVPEVATSFEFITGTSLKKLEFHSAARCSTPRHLALAFEPFPNLESLKVHIEMYDLHGGLNQLLIPDPVFECYPFQPPSRLRRLSLLAFYDDDQFYSAEAGERPCFGPLLHLPHQFAESLECLKLEIRRDFDIGKWHEDFHLVNYDADHPPLAFTRSFPRLRRLALAGLASTLEPLLRSIDSTKFPSLESCLCGFDSVRDSEHAPPDLDDVTSRIPVFQLAKSSREMDATAEPLARWAHQRESVSPYHHAEESTWPEPVRNPRPTVDTTALSARLDFTLEHLNEWYRSARDAQDADALVKNRDLVEGVDARMTVMNAWTGSGAAAPQSRPENA